MDETELDRPTRMELMMMRRARDREPGTPQAPRNSQGRWIKGNPGRVKGSRNRITNRLAMALLDDFQCYEEENIERLRRRYFPIYVQLMARFLPRETGAGGPDFGSYSPDEMAKVVAAAREALERIDRGDGALDDLASALEQDPAATLSLEDISKTVNYGESTVADGE
jgi:hypothetical protein